MRIFVAGGTGVLGRRAVALMVEAGHVVTVVSRSPDREAAVRDAGAVPANVDVFDAVAVTTAVDGHDVVANLATHIPRASRMAMPSAWKDNDRLRTAASTNLAAAALTNGAARFIQESIAFVYADAGGAWITEDRAVEATANLASALVAESNAARVADSGGIGIALRFAQFYGPDSHTTLDTIRFARRRVAGGFGKDAYVSSITTDDAASAVLAALDAPSGLYNVGDDDPLTRQELAAVVAAAVGAKPPIIPPRRMAPLSRRPGCGAGPVPAGVEQALPRDDRVVAEDRQRPPGLARGRRGHRGPAPGELGVRHPTVDREPGFDQFEQCGQPCGLRGVARPQQDAFGVGDRLADLEDLELAQHHRRGKPLDGRSTGTDRIHLLPSSACPIPTAAIVRRANAPMSTQGPTGSRHTDPDIAHANTTEMIGDT